MKPFLKQLIRPRWWNPLFWASLTTAATCCFVVLLVSGLCNAVAESAKLCRDVISDMLTTNYTRP